LAPPINTRLFGLSSLMILARQTQAKFCANIVVAEDSEFEPGDQLTEFEEPRAGHRLELGKPPAMALMSVPSRRGWNGLDSVHAV
jgi:hypothetical protein